MSGNRTRQPLPDHLTDAERDFYTELRTLLLDLAGWSSRSLERPALAGPLGGHGRARWDAWLNGKARPPVEVVTSVIELLTSREIEARHLIGLWRTAFAAGRPGADQLPRPHQLPSAIAHFTGRIAELQALTQLAGLTADTGGAVVITAIGGTAGVGKTALAVHWAHQAASQFPDGQLYVNLRGYDPFDPVQPADAIRCLLEALAVPAAKIPAGEQAQTGLYRSLLAGRKMLIVLDNARDPAQVRPLLPGTPGSMVLVTSRSQMTGLAAVDGAHLLSLDVLDDAEACTLLARRLGRDRVTADPGAATDLLSLCARLPLALNIVAALAAAQPARPLAALAADLRDRSAPLDALETGDPASSVRTVFSWSYQSLPAGPARMFRLLGLHPGPDITAAAAASLAGVPAGQARQVLRDLTAAHLLTEHAPGRYAFHDLLRAYAAEQAARYDSDPDRLAATSRMLDHYLHTASTAAALLCPGRDLLGLPGPLPGVAPEPLSGGADALAWFAAERPVLSSAVAQAAEAGFGAVAWQLGWTAGRLYHRRGYRREWITMLEASLAAAEAAGDLAGQAHVRRDLGTAYGDCGLSQHGEPHLRRAMELYEQLGDLGGQAHTELYLGRMREQQGQIRPALDHAYRALAIFEAARHVAGQANALTNAGSGHSALGEHKQALACFERALPLHQASRNLDGECYAWAGLGETYQHLGQSGQAIECDHRAAAMFRELGNRTLLAEVLTHLGDHLTAAGQLEQARPSWREALVILDDLHDPAAGEVQAKLARLDPAAV